MLEKCYLKLWAEKILNGEFLTRVSERGTLSRTNVEKSGDRISYLLRQSNWFATLSEVMIEDCYEIPRQVYIDDIWRAKYSLRWRKYEICFNPTNLRVEENKNKMKKEEEEEEMKEEKEETIYVQVFGGRRCV